MSSSERRIVTRKAYAIPVRFNVVTEQFAMAAMRGGREVQERAVARTLTTIPLPQQGETVNLSERGICFKTRKRLAIGESVEIFFTLPTALTGRADEDVRCKARVVHVEKNADMEGHVGIGAAIECFERTSAIRNWDN
jgi:hypothetical protein